MLVSDVRHLPFIDDQIRVIAGGEHLVHGGLEIAHRHAVVAHDLAFAEVLDVPAMLRGDDDGVVGQVVAHPFADDPVAVLAERLHVLDR